MFAPITKVNEGDVKYTLPYHAYSTLEVTYFSGWKII
jgi:hypothetical protein